MGLKTAALILLTMFGENCGIANDHHASEDLGDPRLGVRFDLPEQSSHN
jgi:hypothetical protein